jgi:hypothetical protein
MPVAAIQRQVGGRVLEPRGGPDGHRAGFTAGDIAQCEVVRVAARGVEWSRSGHAAMPNYRQPARTASGFPHHT